MGKVPFHVSMAACANKGIDITGRLARLLGPGSQCSGGKQASHE